jgi:D-alanyl-lipoteichoic acid acyltransferase DltB (MBOAT superfamily)
MNLAIILPSIAINYAIANSIRARISTDKKSDRLANSLVWIGVAFNICVLGYFKYKNFFLGSINDLIGTDFSLITVALPLGISFITFQKIAFLIDVRAGSVRQFDLFDFLTFVFFFPQLIAGPIVHYREMMPQFAQINDRLRMDNVATGISLFAIGLFKKVVLADGVAAYVPSVFSAAANGDSVSFFAGWTAALAYTFQIYFDFSGYSDMAIGLARIFGIKLPMNFNSPLKATSIIEFWTRWHITLTRFLTAYVYTPVVMSLTRARMRKGKPVLSRKKPTVSAFAALLAWPTVLTMFLSGFWHGAGYTFLVWGLLHGCYLVVNHGWRQWRPNWEKSSYDKIMVPLGFVLTFTSVVIGMVFFRATSVTAAGRILHGMAGLDGITLPQSILNRLGGAGTWIGHLGISGDSSSGAAFVAASLWVCLLFLVATLMPNSLELMQRHQPALYFEAMLPQAGRRASAWIPKLPARAMSVEWKSLWAIGLAALFVSGVLGLNRVSEFLYWQF